MMNRKPGRSPAEEALEDLKVPMRRKFQTKRLKRTRTKGIERRKKRMRKILVTIINPTVRTNQDQVTEIETTDGEQKKHQLKRNQLKAGKVSIRKFYSIFDKNDISLQIVLVNNDLIYQFLSERQRERDEREKERFRKREEERQRKWQLQKEERQRQKEASEAAKAQSESGAQNSDKIAEDTSIEAQTADNSKDKDRLESTKAKDLNIDSSHGGSSRSKRYSDRRKEERTRKPVESGETVDQLSKELSKTLHVDEAQTEERREDSKKDSRDNFDAEKRKNRVSKCFFNSFTFTHALLVIS